MEIKQAPTALTQVIADILIGILASFLGATVQWILWPWVGPSRFILFFPAVMIASLVGSLYSGIASTLVGAALSVYLFSEPAFTFQNKILEDIVPISIFLVLGSSIAYVVDKLQRRIAELAAEKTLNEASKQVRQSEQNLAYALEVGKLGAWSLDIKTRQVKRSLLHDQIFGYSTLLPEWTHQTFIEHIVPEDRAAAKKGFEDTLISSGEFHLECRIRRADGAIRWIEVQGNTYSQNNEVTQLVGLTKDITERKNAENILKQFVEQSPFAVCLLDNEMKYLIASNRWISDFHLKLEEILGKSHYEVFPDIPEHWKKIHRRCLAGAVEKNDEEAFIRADGTINWIRWEVRPWYNFGGKIGGILIFSEDISERKRMQDILKENELQFHTMFDAIPQLAWMAHPDGFIFLYNQRWYEFTGTTAKQMEGWGWQSVHDPQMLPKVMKQWKTALSTAQTFEMEFPLRRADGIFRWFLTRIVPLKTPEGRVLRWIGTNTDITKFKEAELALLEAKTSAENTARLKSRFLDIAAHELRTPVTALSLMLQLMQIQIERRHPIDPNSSTRLRAQVDRLSRLVVDLTEVSRLERGQLNLKRELVDLGMLISDCIETFKFQAPSRRLTLSNPEKKIEANIDPVRIYQVIINLLDNANKYTPEDASIELGVETDQERILISVTDHGPGITENQKRTMFQPFERGSGSKEEKSSGLGLGLYISREIVELHGGKIGVKSEVGAGSTFYFELPRIVSARKAA